MQTEDPPPANLDERALELILHLADVFAKVGRPFSFDLERVSVSCKKEKGYFQSHHLTQLISGGLIVEHPCPPRLLESTRLFGVPPPRVYSFGPQTIAVVPVANGRTRLIPILPGYLKEEVTLRTGQLYNVRSWGLRINRFMVSSNGDSVGKAVCVAAPKAQSKRKTEKNGKAPIAVTAEPVVLLVPDVGIVSGDASPIQKEDREVSSGNVVKPAPLKGASAATEDTLTLPEAKTLVALVMEFGDADRIQLDVAALAEKQGLRLDQLQTVIGWLKVGRYIAIASRGGWYSLAKGFGWESAFKVTEIDSADAPVVAGYDPLPDLELKIGKVYHLEGILEVLEPQPDEVVADLPTLEPLPETEELSAEELAVARELLRQFAAGWHVQPTPNDPQHVLQQLAENGQILDSAEAHVQRVLTAVYRRVLEVRRDIAERSAAIEAILQPGKIEL